MVMYFIMALLGCHKTITSFKKIIILMETDFNEKCNTIRGPLIILIAVYETVLVAANVHNKTNHGSSAL